MAKPEIQIDQTTINIEWEDGHTGVYPHRFLRLHCQCAHCIDELTHQARLDPATVSDDIKAIDHMLVGNYAIQFLWSDTHYTGLYTYDFLKSHCCCKTCGTAPLA
tara:strand:+ start:473 stop:787 length:315 start_codon:yes stop_codon:yes gene_type:complete